MTRYFISTADCTIRACLYLSIYLTWFDLLGKFVDLFEILIIILVIIHPNLERYRLSQNLFVK